MKKLFSCVIPIYNTAHYLNETIDSVINQSIGFTDNIELILVNDGSTDESEKICKEYLEKYKDNIIYLAQENSGVSVARNFGYKNATGKYINFLDSDDKWSTDAFENVYEFLSCEEEVSIIGCPMTRFDAMTNEHKLNPVFKNGSRTINITDENEIYTLRAHINSTFFLSSLISDISFVPNMKYGEDVLFLGTALIKCKKLSLCDNATYYFRRRADESSAIQNQRKNKIYYLETPNDFYGGLIKKSKDEFGSVIPYIQSLIAYDIGWRVSVPLKDELTSDEKNKYFGLLSEILSTIDNKIILKSPYHKKLTTKLAILNIKYEKDVIKDFTFVNDNATLFGIKVSSISKNKGLLFIDSIEYNENEFVVSGRICDWLFRAFDGARLSLFNNNVDYIPKLIKSDVNIDKTIFGQTMRYREFKEAFPAKKNEVQKVIPYFIYNENKMPMAINFPLMFEKDDDDIKTFDDVTVKKERMNVTFVKAKSEEKAIKLLLKDENKSGGFFNFSKRN